MNPRNLLIALSIVHKGNWDGIMKAIRSRERPDVDVDALVAGLHSKVTTILDDDYPEGLRHAYKPPFVLYYYGNLSLAGECERCIGYVGSRKAGEYGLKMAKTLCSGLAEKGYSIVSGLAYGIDKAAGEASLDYGKSIAVLGNGIDYEYPSENAPLQRDIKEKGLLISEYPNDVPPTPDKFPSRNRIVAGISSATVVGEAYRHSGTLITVSLALGMGRDVLAVPYRADEDSACNLLIKEGAPAVETVEDVLSYIRK
ncbi:MAG: DNA-processing protein DprA [Bacilli bacterium]|nr:DNA-processing protein DprA [Bacilli bacterium]